LRLGGDVRIRTLPKLLYTVGRKCGNIIGLGGAILLGDYCENRQPAADARLHTKPRSTNALKLKLATSLLLYFFLSLFSYSYLSATTGSTRIALRAGI
jgi:hypothetical protein